MRPRMRSGSSGIRDRTYLGESVARKTMVIPGQRHRNGKPKMKESPEAQRVRLSDGSTEPLVDVRLFEQANAAIEENRCRPRAQKNPTHLLAGHIWCRL